MLAPPSQIEYKLATSFIKSVSTDDLTMEDSSVTSYVTGDTLRQIEVMRQAMIRQRQCPTCKVPVTSKATPQDLKLHSTRHHILYVCFCGTMDSRLKFIKLHSKKEQHGVQHIFKVDRISWPHLRTLVRNLPPKIPPMPYMRFYNFEKRDPIWGLPKRPQIGKYNPCNPQEDELGGGKSPPPTAESTGLAAMAEFRRPGCHSLATQARKFPAITNTSLRERPLRQDLQEEEDWG